MYFSATNTRGHRSQMFQIKSKHLQAVQKKVPIAHYGRYRYSVYTYVSSQTAVLGGVVCQRDWEAPDSLCFRLTTLANAHRYGHSGWSARLREITYMNTTVFVEDSPCHEYFQHLYVPRVVAHLAQVTNL